MKKSIVLLLLVALLAGGGWYGRQRGWLPWLGRPAAEADSALPGPGGPGGPGGARRGGSGGQDGRTPVVVTPVTRADVPVIVEGIGTVQAFASVTVRAQVDGRILELGFREGQDVTAGDVIARIDPASYRAVYDQAVARREQDTADLANARTDLDRYNRLAQSESGSRQQADTQRAVVAKLEAQLKIDQGVIDAAKVDLDNTVIRAPISGRTGIRAVDVGNLVRSADTTGLVTIAQLKPISVAFTLPQQQLAAILAAEARGPVPVEVLGDRREPVDRGEIAVIDNQVDTTTGTVKIKATLPNAAMRLWPGQFVDVRVLVDTLKDAVVVPSAAVQRGVDGPYLWLLGAEDAVSRRPVTVTRQDETRAVIASGMAPGDVVLTTGFTRLTEGAKVKPTPTEEAGATPTPSVTPPAPAAGERRGGGAGGEGRRQRSDGTPPAQGGTRPGTPP